MKTEKKALTRTKKRLIFYCLILAFPVIQFCVFYFYVNFRTFAFAFQTYGTDEAGKLISSFAGFSNFKDVFNILVNRAGLLKNSVIYYFVHLIIGTGLGTVFSYYIYKRNPFASFFKIILFIPHIVATIIFVRLYTMLCNDGYVQLMSLFGKEATGLLLTPGTRYWAILFFNVWLGFGSTVLLMTGAMSGINDAVIESAQLDGVSAWQEFIRIVVPMIFPTLQTFVIVGLSTIFTHQMNIFSFYPGVGEAATDVQTFGYRFFVDAKSGHYIAEISGNSQILLLPQLSALGLCFSLVTFAIVTVVRKLMDKYGPSVD